MNLPDLLERARVSSWWRWWLNVALRRLIPFNRPHGLWVEPLPEGGIRVRVPYRRVNRNHIRGVHACCLATAAEFCSGLALMEHVGAERHRIIMKTLRMEYLYQARSAAVAEFVPTASELEQALLQPLRNGASVLYTAEVPVADREGKQLAIGYITWQLKPWDQVRTPTGKG